MTEGYRVKLVTVERQTVGGMTGLFQATRYLTRTGFGLPAEAYVYPSFAEAAAAVGRIKADPGQTLRVTIEAAEDPVTGLPIEAEPDLN